MLLEAEVNMSPKTYDKCVKTVKKQIKKKPTYINKKGKRVKSSAYAICSKLRKGGKKR